MVCKNRFISFIFTYLTVQLILEPEDDADSCVRTLKFDNLTAEEFDLTCKACVRYRLNDPRTLATTSAIMEKWPFYKNPTGFRLVSILFIQNMLGISVHLFIWTFSCILKIRHQMGNSLEILYFDNAVPIIDVRWYCQWDIFTRLKAKIFSMECDEC